MDDTAIEQLLSVAQRYYTQDETMESIAHQLGVSRSTVSRLLKEARARGLVRITVAEPNRPLSKVAKHFKAAFKVNAHLVQVRPGASEILRLDQVARQAASIVTNAVTDGDTVGIAWGTTISAVASHLSPINVRGVTVCGLNGGGNSQTTGLPYVGSIVRQFAEAFQAQQQPLALPAFFDDPATREAMWRERSTQHMLAVRASSTIAVFGVGGLAAELQSHVYSSNYLTEADQAGLVAQGVVGDVCTVMIREDGSYRDLEINKRATGMTPAELKRIPRRICVVSGLAKTAPLLGALRAGVATDLVIDEDTARAVLHRMNPQLRLL
ncbi:MAG: sugar-binding domain-containing protein [Propionibacteriaceae bacterium]|nr:sugar-binding domain-containing protein [Propionibacteriaceae bacterium]